MLAGSDVTSRPAGTQLRQLRSRGRLRGGAALLGPAFVAAIAYVDPGNFATNFSAEAAFAYSLAAAALFSHSGHSAQAAAVESGSIEAAHADLGRMAGGAAALAFAVALLASGLSSSSVGTYAGQVVMQGFTGRSVPLFARRAITMLPALIALAAGLPPTATLVISQVVLSFGIPFALMPLVALTRRADVMGSLVNRPLTTCTAAGTTGIIIALNAYLLAVTLLH